MGRTVCNRNSLFKRSIPPYDFKWRFTHDADQRQVLKEVLSLIKDPSHDQVNITVGPKAYHPSFDDDQLMKLCLLMILCLISDRFIIKILVVRATRNDGIWISNGMTASHPYTREKGVLPVGVRTVVR